MNKCCYSYTFSVIFSIDSFFHVYYSDRCVGFHLVILIFNALITSKLKNLFLCLFSIFIFFSKGSIHVFVHLKNLLFVFLLNFKSYFCMLNPHFSSYMCFANIFSQYMVCLFILLTVYFMEQKFSILIKYNSSIFNVSCFESNIKRSIAKLKIS